MFVFGHLGIGSKLAKPCSAGLSLRARRALLVGTILPDLIDKPLYYALVFLTGRHGAELGMLGGTRLFGHTFLFLIALLLLAAVVKPWRSLFGALALGVATHLLLDNVADAIREDVPRSAFIAMVWPWYGLDFPAIPYRSMSAHLYKVLEPHILACEGLGLVILLRDYWLSRDDRKARRLRARTSRH